MSGAAPDPGYRRAPASGLFVPEAYSRVREVVTTDEWKALSRAITKVLGPRRIKFLLLCEHPGCPAPRIDRVRNEDGGFTLRCGHADRVFSPAI